MKEEIEKIIKQLERAQELLHQGRNGEAETVIYEAQLTAIFLRDHGT